MATRMLIDARHPEETRVAVLKGNRIDEFDFESADRKQLKGNIYLAKVTRVEPSLQAAFVDFGGNRHGFLAFSEIHPDYYQIPKEDREALLAEEAAHAAEEAELRAREEAEGIDEVDDEDGDEDDDGGLTEVDTSEKDEISTIEDGQVENDEDAESEQGDVEDDSTDDDASDDEVEASDGEMEEEADGEESEADSDEEEAGEADDEKSNDRRSRRRGRRRQSRGRSKEADDLRARRMALRRRYKIQDVIQRRQVLLVQVVKEERGSKGAALTTYLSLAGRYCVLMPNSSHGGGISRKISSASDRKRLKGIINDLNLPKTMGCIVRTAGLSRTKTEIKRDFDYLARLWDELREKTLSSSAPSLIHSDSDLIKRAIRDIYNRDIEEVVVEGEDGYKAAKAFMKLLMPSHARRVKSYNDPVPLFQRYGAEDQLTAMYDPVVQLKSGGYIVINPTEALVSIDINSGRSTKEHGIEATAVNTNIEAAREIARQLRLRDMAGLVVIDFIDMDYNSNVRKVERAMKDALKSDRARIQVGRISSFGLMEMSRQRLRTGVLESTTRECPHCDGTGLVRTASSAGLSALRLIEDEAAKGRGSTISLFASTEAAVYLLNSKRSDLADIEARYGVSVEVIPEGEDEGAKMRVASSGPRNENMPEFAPIVDDDDDDDEDIFDEAEEEEEAPRKKRRRRRGGRGRNRGKSDADAASESADDEGSVEAPEEDEDGEETPRKRRRRGGRRRRGRGSSEETAGENESEEAANEEAADAGADEEARQAEPVADEADVAVEEAGDGAYDSAEEEPAPKKRSRRKKAEAADEPNESETSDSDDAKEDEEAEKPKRSRRKKAESADGDAETAKPKRSRRKKAEVAETAEPAAEAETSEAGQPDADEDHEAIAVAPPDASLDDGEGEQPAEIEAVQASAEPPRRGWWQRTFGDE